MELLFLLDSSSANPSPEVETAEDKEEKDEDDDDVSFKTGEKVITHPTGELSGSHLTVLFCYGLFMTWALILQSLFAQN